MRTEPNDYKDIHEFLDEHGEELDQGIIHEEDISTIFDFFLEMAMSDYREVKSKLRLLLQHILKYQYQQTRQTPSWIKTIRNCRIDIYTVIRDSKSLGNKLTPEIFEIYFNDAKKEVMKETGMSKNEFPDQCPFNIDKILNDDYIESFLINYAYTDSAKKYLYIK